MRRRAWRLLPHTADLLVEARAANRASLYASCAEAVFSLLTDRRRVRPRVERRVRVEAPADPERLFLMLRAALALFSVDRFLVRGARVTMKGRMVTLLARGEPFDASRHVLDREIKAITAHALAVERTAGGFLARFVVDV